LYCPEFLPSELLRSDVGGAESAIASLTGPDAAFTFFCASASANDVARNVSRIARWVRPVATTLPL
jgi:hypothetical protein